MEKRDYIGFHIEEATKKQFQELCKERGSNMTVELRKYIYKQLNEAGK